MGHKASEGVDKRAQGQGLVKGRGGSGLSLSEQLSNNAMQPTACAVGKQVKDIAVLAPVAADGGR